MANIFLRKGLTFKFLKKLLCICKPCSLAGAPIASTRESAPPALPV